MNEAAVGRLSADTRALMLYETNKRSLGLSYVLWLFLGGFGAHRFYNGRAGSAVGIIVLNVFGWITLAVGVGFLLLAAVGIWVLVDAFLIPGWVSAHNIRLMASLDQPAGSPPRQHSVAPVSVSSASEPVTVSPEARLQL